MALPALLMLIGGVIDYGHVLAQRQRLQDAADASALAAARELGLADAKRESVQAVVEAMVNASMAINGGRSLPTEVKTSVRDEPLEVRVVARQASRLVFGEGFGLAPGVIEVEAVARIVGRPSICVLGLDPTASGTISLEKEARVTAQNCAVFSNSSHPAGIRSKDSAVLSASLICSAGGSDGGRGSFTPDPFTDCPTFDDPLGGRPEPAVGPCDPAAPRRVQVSRSLSPGTFCGGLRIEGAARAELAPGLYVIRDGELRVADDASLVGSGVVFFFTGKGARIVFERGSTIDISAPSSGALAGLLFFESRAQPVGIRHEVLSDNARNLLGTIYLPRGRLHVDANNPVADMSSYTAIVARRLTLYGGPHLVLNANYDASRVPVPEGIRGAGQPAVLVK